MGNDTGASRRQLSMRDRFLGFPIDGQAVKSMTEAGLTWLRTNQESVNALNVFPVPDGDTGTNMVLTMQSAFDEVVDSPERNLGKMIHAVAHGALMGARGNSGVILSQLWRGFARELDEAPLLDGEALVRAFAEARDTAYRGVVRPVEGTILTVAKDIAGAAERAIQETDVPVEIFEAVVSAADESVKRTPELLPVLRDAGVVDAGGKGLFFILEGMLRHIHGLPLDTPTSIVKPLAAIQLGETMETIEPGQDFEVVVDFKPHAPLILEQFYAELESMGTSIQVGEGEGVYRVHIHVPTENRYLPIDYTMGLGTITKVAMENLIAQMEDLGQAAGAGRINLSAVEPGEIAAITVAPGPGIARVFASLGAAAIIEGGQTMNPSTQEIIHSFENLPTDLIIILPNNKNILLAAKAAAEVTVKKVAVIPSRTVPQGLAAMLSLNPGGDFDQVVEDMQATLNDVVTGEITRAVRTTEIDGVQCMEGQYIVVMDDGQERRLILAVDELEEALLGFLEQGGASDRELITLFWGAEMAKGSVNQLVDRVRAAYPDQEVEVQEGGQPHYHFIVGIE